mmetsp:Transcript_78807/g.189120  ORF Transcript_78807/g.189120 Transcript_78807/m.189120 type:complete len:378 (+) Transcript_78807:715-1848(+)
MQQLQLLSRLLPPLCVADGQAIDALLRSFAQHLHVVAHQLSAGLCDLRLKGTLLLHVLRTHLYPLLLGQLKGLLASEEVLLLTLEIDGELANLPGGVIHTGKGLCFRSMEVLKSHSALLFLLRLRIEAFLHRPQLFQAVHLALGGAPVQLIALPLNKPLAAAGNLRLKIIISTSLLCQLGRTYPLLAPLLQGLCPLVQGRPAALALALVDLRLESVGAQRISLHDLLGLVPQVGPLVSLVEEALRQRLRHASPGPPRVELRAGVDGGLKGTFSKLFHLLLLLGLHVLLLGRLVLQLPLLHPLLECLPVLNRTLPSVLRAFRLRRLRTAGSSTCRLCLGGRRLRPPGSLAFQVRNKKRAGTELSRKLHFCLLGGCQAR